MPLTLSLSYVKCVPVDLLFDLKTMSLVRGGFLHLWLQKIPIKPSSPLTTNQPGTYFSDPENHPRETTEDRDKTTEDKD